VLDQVALRRLCTSPVTRSRLNWLVSPALNECLLEWADGFAESGREIRHRGVDHLEHLYQPPQDRNTAGNCPKEN